MHGHTTTTSSSGRRSPLNISVGNEIPGSADPDFNKGCEVIWKFIADELDGCWPDLTAEDGSSATRNRMNQGMNRMLKMRLLLNSQLFTGVDRYGECATLAQEIIDGKYGTYNLASDYRTIYGVENSSCPRSGIRFLDGGRPHDQQQPQHSLPALQLRRNVRLRLRPGRMELHMPQNPPRTTPAPSCPTPAAKVLRALFDYGDKLGAPFRPNERPRHPQAAPHCDAAGN